MLGGLAITASLKFIIISVDALLVVAGANGRMTLLLAIVHIDCFRCVSGLQLITSFADFPLRRFLHSRLERMAQSACMDSKRKIGGSTGAGSQA